MPEAARRPLVSGNWKMNLNHFEAIQTVQKLNWALAPEDTRAADVTVHPPFTDLRSVQTVVEADAMAIVLGAQNCHENDTGAFTGEVSAAMLAKLNVSYVIVGHSERRAMGETDAQVAAKAQAVLRNAMSPIVCVGEQLSERDEGRTEDVLTSQLQTGLAKVNKDSGEKVVVAYEPVWAIGTGKAASPFEAADACKFIRGVLSKMFDQDVADKIRIQYGGSVKPSNARELIASTDIDGFLVGGASLKPEEFAKIVAAMHD